MVLLIPSPKPQLGARLTACRLWTYAETVRKVARSWTNALSLISASADFQFCASQAQHYEWMRLFYPAIFARVQAAVACGRWKIVGGTWVEHDMLLPSGESLIRQFAVGCAFFEHHFKQRPTTLFLPDTFGYCSQVPQIAKLFKYKNFVSIKISWSLFNSFPHSTFVWQGSDGSALTAHFPPAGFCLGLACYGWCLGSETLYDPTHLLTRALQTLTTATRAYPT